MPLNSFNDLSKFIDILNNEFASGDFMFGGKVKRKDLVEYGRWLKDSSKKIPQKQQISLGIINQKITGL